MPASSLAPLSNKLVTARPHVGGAPRKQLNLFLVGDHLALRRGMEMLLRSQGHFVVGSADDAGRAVKAEHERFDGHGYPDGLQGEEIPLASRIAFACDAYHAMTSDRPYRAALAPEKARAEMLAGAGSQFDPAVVKALLAVIDGEGITGPAGVAAPGETVAAGVLAASSPRQTPVWEPQAPPDLPAALGSVRAACRRCGTHTAAVVTQAAMGGMCGNCGGYELDLVDG